MFVSGARPKHSSNNYCVIKDARKIRARGGHKEAVRSEELKLNSYRNVCASTRVLENQTVRNIKYYNIMS